MKNAFIILAVLLLSACAEAELASHVVKKMPSPIQPSPYVSKNAKGKFKVGNPYRIKGRKYIPEETYSYSRTGIASWYGPGFHGKMTANGEYFDQNELTAAHKTLHMPSLVRVTNLDNGRSIVVRVNDRGPYAHGRLIDLSKRGAELLAFKSKGTAKVRIDVLAEESRAIADMAKKGFSTRGTEIAVNENRSFSFDRLNDQDPVRRVSRPPTSIRGDIDNGNFIPDPIITQTPLSLDNPDIFIQAGSFTNALNADRLANSLRRFETTTVQEMPIGGITYYRVRVGPLNTTAQADMMLAQLIQNGYQGAKIVID